MWLFCTVNKQGCLDCKVLYLWKHWSPGYRGTPDRNALSYHTSQRVNANHVLSAMMHTCGQSNVTRLHILYRGNPRQGTFTRSARNRPGLDCVTRHSAACYHVLCTPNEHTSRWKILNGFRLNSVLVLLRLNVKRTIHFGLRVYVLCNLFFDIDIELHILRKNCKGKWRLTNSEEQFLEKPPRLASQFKE
jgi:hypothetical protein